MSVKALAELTWNYAYPDKAKWSELTELDQMEWVRLFSIYESFIGKSISVACGSQHSTGSDVSGESVGNNN